MPEQKQKLIKIKTLGEFNKALHDYKQNGESTYIVLDPEFDTEILWIKPTDNTKNYKREFMVLLVENAIRHYNSQQRVALFNRYMDAFYDYFRLWRMGFIETPGFTHQKHNTELYEILYLTNTYLPRIYISPLLSNNEKYNKKITPDNQVLAFILNRFGVHNIGPHHYYANPLNFSNTPFTNEHFIRDAINMLDKTDHARTMIQEKFDRDFGNTNQQIDPKKFFPHAQDSETLYNLRNGKISALDAIKKLSPNDLKYIVPSMDLKNESASTLYDIMSRSGRNWSAFQIQSIMSMIIDKSPANIQYLDEILRILDTNKNIFDPKTKTNREIYIKLSQKFGDLIDQSIYANQEIIKSLQDIWQEIPRIQQMHENTLDQIAFLKYETQEYNTLIEQTLQLETFAKPEYYQEHASNIRRAIDAYFSNGIISNIATPEKPWRIFASTTEKKNYKQLVTLIQDVNNFTASFAQNRDKKFGAHDFSNSSKLTALQAHCRTLDDAIKHKHNQATFLSQQNSEQKTNIAQNTKAQITEHQDAYRTRIDRARKTLESRGITFGEKSGVIINEQKIKEREFENKIEQKIALLRKQPTFRNTPDEQLRDKAILIIQQEQNKNTR